MKLPHHFALILARVVVGVCGALLMYIALFLYEKEAGNYQNRLEELWVRIDDLSRTALTQQAAFIKQTLGLLSFGFDTLFGNNLISLRSITVTLAYSVGSFYILAEAAILGFALESRETAMWSLGAAGLSSIQVILGTSLAFVKDRQKSFWWSWIVIFITFAIPTSLEALNHGLQNMQVRDFLEITLFLTGSIICDVLFIALNRAVLKFTASRNSSVQMIFLVVCNGTILFAYMAPYFLIHNGILTSLPSRQDLIWSISASNLITALLASGMVLIMLVALLHRVFWPFLSRPIYAMTRYGIIKNQKLLLTMALMLLTWALPAWKPFWTILGKV